MKLIKILQSIGLAKPTDYINDFEAESTLHHHDTTEGCELLDQTVHMYDESFEDSQQEDFPNNK